MLQDVFLFPLEHHLYLLMYQIPYSKNFGEFGELQQFAKLFCQYSEFSQHCLWSHNCLLPINDRKGSQFTVTYTSKYINMGPCGLLFQYGNSFFLAIWLKWYCRSWCKIRKNSWSYEGKILHEHSLKWLTESFYTTTCWCYSREIITLVGSSVL